MKKASQKCTCCRKHAQKFIVPRNSDIKLGDIVDYDPPYDFIETGVALLALAIAIAGAVYLYLHV